MSYHVSSVSSSNRIRINGSTESTDTSTGSLTLGGGVGISKTVTVDGNVFRNGFLSTSISSTSSSDSLDEEYEIIVTNTATISLPNTTAFPDTYKGVVYRITKQEESGPSFVVTIETPNANTISRHGALSTSTTIEGSYLSTIQLINIDNIWYASDINTDHRGLTQPTGIIASALPGIPGSVSVSFIAPVLAEPTKILYYKVTSDPSVTTSIGVESPVVVTGLTSGTPYTFQVQGVTQYLSGDLSVISNSAIPL